MEPTSLKETYDTEGYVIAREVLDADLISEASAHIEWLLKQNPDLRPENLHNGLVKDDPFWLRLLSDDRLLDLAEPFIGPDIALFASHYIAKPPRVGQPVSWHQDGSYWPLEPMKVITLWLAVSDSRPENGCMRVIPRTQNTRLLDLEELQEDKESVLGTSMSTDQVNEEQAVDLILGPGDVSIHHPNIIHGSSANKSEKWRKGLTIRYIPTSTRVTKPEVTTTFLLRGTVVPGINTYPPFPKYIAGKHMPFRGCEAW